MELWIPITIAAAFFQNIRSALQKVLKEALSDTGATFVRFGFGFPLALAYLAFLVAWLEEPLPQPNSSFLVFGLVGGTSQILATFLLVRAATSDGLADPWVSGRAARSATTQPHPFGHSSVPSVIGFMSQVGRLAAV